MFVPKLIKLICVLTLSVCLLPSSTVMGSQTSEERQQLLMFYEPTDLVTTTIATKTKMHSDLTPGMTTLLQGEDLERKGIRTVGEALALLPGIDFTFGQNGTSALSFRGVGLGSNRKIKAMLNGVPMNASLQGEVVPLFFIPIEQVERIEVIRGPGSALYGKWAFLGTINVVTYKNGNRIFTRLGSYDARHGGLVTSYESPDESLKASLNIGAWERDVTDIVSGPDQFTDDSRFQSNAPGPVNDSRESPTGVATFKYKWLSVIGQSTETSFGSYFGLSNGLPPFDTTRNQTERIQTVEARLHPVLPESMDLKVNFGIRNYLWDSGKMWMFPAGYIIPDTTYMASHYEEEALFSGMDFVSAYFKSHKILLGLAYEMITMHDVWFEANLDPLSYGPTPYQRYTGDKNWIKDNLKRNICSIYLQDQFQATDRLAITGGLRFDYYNDIDAEYNQFSPRIAGVYNINKNHVLKAQYANAFRPPSFSEKSAHNVLFEGSCNLREETVDTYELGHIYKNHDFSVSTILFYSYLKNLINGLDTHHPVNKGKATATGMEVEFSWNINELLHLDTNLSYVDTEDKETHTEIGGGTKWIANSALIYRFRTDYFLTGTYNYVGKRYRLQGDSRPALKDYHRFGAVAGVDNLITKGFKVQVGVNNIFDEDIRYQSRIFEDDYPSTGREFWLQLSLRF